MVNNLFMQIGPGGIIAIVVALLIFVIVFATSFKIVPKPMLTSWSVSASTIPHGMLGSIFGAVRRSNRKKNQPKRAGFGL